MLEVKPSGQQSNKIALSILQSQDFILVDD